MRRRARQMVADRPLSFVSFALVVVLGGGVARIAVNADMYMTRRSRRCSAWGCAVVRCAFRSSRHRCQAGPGRELVSRSDQCGITDGGEQFGAEPKSHAGHAGDHLGEWMAAKSALDVGVGGLDAVIEGSHSAPDQRPNRRPPLRRAGAPSGFSLRPPQPSRSRRRCAHRHRPRLWSAAKHRFAEWLWDAGSAPADHPATVLGQLSDRSNAGHTAMSCWRKRLIVRVRSATRWRDGR